MVSKDSWLTTIHAWKLRAGLFQILFQLLTDSLTYWQLTTYSFFRALTVSSDSCPWSTDSCPTDSCPHWQLSALTVVRSDSCPILQMSDLTANIWQLSANPFLVMNRETTAARLLVSHLIQPPSFLLRSRPATLVTPNNNFLRKNPFRRRKKPRTGGSASSPFVNTARPQVIDACL